MKGLTWPAFPHDSAHVSAGRFPGDRPGERFGFNSDIDNGAAETIWSPGGVYAVLTAAEACSILSSSANDADDETGARTVRVTYLTTGYVEVVETLTLNGTTGVSLSQDCVAVNCMEVITAGSGKVNAGTIQVTTDALEVVLNEIPLDGAVGTGTSQAMVYTVPAGRKLILERHEFDFTRPLNQLPLVTVRGWKETALGARVMWFRERFETEVKTSHEMDFPTGPVFIAGDAITFEAETSKSDTTVGGRFWFRELTP